MSKHNPHDDVNPEPDPGLRETAKALNSGAIHLLRGMRTIDRRSGLTPARLSALSVLVFGGPCSLGTLATKEGVASPTMTRIVDGLVTLGLAQRETHPENGRMAIISPTPEGTTLMLAAADRRIEAIVHGMQTLPPDDQEALIAAAPILRRLAGIIRDQSPD